MQLNVLSWARLTQSTIPSYFLNIHFNIILPSMPRSSKWSLTLMFTLQTPELITPSLNCKYKTNSKLPICRQDSNCSPWNGSRFETVPCTSRSKKKKSYVKTTVARLSIWDILSANKPFVGFSWNSVMTFTINCYSSASFIKVGALWVILNLREDIWLLFLLSCCGDIRYRSPSNVVSSERHLLFGIIQGVLPVFSIQASYLDKIQHRRSPRNDISSEKYLLLAS